MYIILQINIRYQTGLAYICYKQGADLCYSKNLKMLTNMLLKNTKNVKKNVNKAQKC